MRLNVDKAADSEKSEEAGAPEIEITQKMVDAGLPFLLRFHRERDDDEEVIKRIFRAMFAASQTACRE